jgi:hypothetical protein
MQNRRSQCLNRPVQNDAPFSQIAPSTRISIRLSLVPVGLLGISLLCIGCAPFRPNSIAADLVRNDSHELAVEVDQHDHPRLDRLEAASDMPGRLIGIKPDHEERLERATASAELAADFLKQNHIDDVRVTVNAYSPKSEWHRLASQSLNRPAWAYPFGTIACLKRTLVPERVTNRDSYNPWTRTLAINSGDEFSALAAAAHVIEVDQAPVTPLGLSLAQWPVFNVLYRHRSSYKVIQLAKAEKNETLAATGYRRLYSDLFSTASMAAVPLVPFYAVPLLTAGAWAVGRGVAEAQISLATDTDTPHSPAQ